MGAPRKLPDPETVRRLYHEDGLTLREIGERYGVLPCSVSEFCKRHGVVITYNGGSRRRHDITGQGRRGWVAIERLDSTPQGASLWRIRCMECDAEREVHLGTWNANKVAECKCSRQVSNNKGSIHAWLRNNFPLAGICVGCGREPGSRERTDGRIRGGTNYAFLGHPGQHSRDIRDYRELCAACHGKLDAQMQRDFRWIYGLVVRALRETSERT